ncbi:hypothetical protein ACFSUJ_19405 [Streptomyces lusitanus]|uniref:hypothetical protein n=1 Tax=Streptomyces lusitanus TaxID=68232 RepID=UPI003613E3B3
MPALLDAILCFKLDNRHLADGDFTAHALPAAVRADLVEYLAGARAGRVGTNCAHTCESSCGRC